MSPHYGMHIGLGLKLREALKNKLETRPPVDIPRRPEVACAKAAEKSGADDSSSMDDNPFTELSKHPHTEDTEVTVAIASQFGYRDECITVDARQNSKGIYILAKGSDSFDTSDKPKKIRSANNHSVLDPYCLVVTRRIAFNGRLDGIVLSVQSPVLVQVIREVVEYFPDNAFRIGETITLNDPPELLYHHRNELSEYQARPDVDERTKLHLRFLLKFLYTQMAEPISTYNAFLAAGMIKYDHLWMMFKPGTYIYEHETQQLYLFKSGVSGADESGRPNFILHCQYVDYDGVALGTVEHDIRIRQFDHQRELSALPVIPFDMHPEQNQIQESLRERGKRFLKMRGIHLLQHAKKGRVVVDVKTCHKQILPGNEDKPRSQKQGIVIAKKCDCVCAVCRKDTEETPDDYDHEVREISDHLLSICSSTVVGFTLNSHSWSQMKVDDLAEVAWSADAIDRLVLDKKQKKVLSSLVKSPIFTEGVEGDVIGWKGKGLVMLMHGAPGTGKTLTAESVCESLRRPLYIVNAGELGTSPESVEKKLQEILELSRLWKAVILIDEADVFLEARSAQDIMRNSFVSVFLRRLEYFEGILMLTTNRVEQFDKAFISRIHLAVNYPELEPWMRKEIWVNALRRISIDQIAIDVRTELVELSEVPLNGRMISYAVRTAKAIADEDQAELTIQHLWDVVSVQQKFNEHVLQKRVANVKS